MFDKVLSFIAPHHCCGCDKIGVVLCSSCKYNITSEQNTTCLVCLKPTVNSNLCRSCKGIISDAWFVGFRKGVLQRLVGNYKFQRVLATADVLVDLLDDVLPRLNPDTVIVPIPTTPHRTRERGYDHMLLIAKKLAKRRGYSCRQLLIRENNTKQRHAGAKLRQVQAKTAFSVDDLLDTSKSYLIVDDVYTTGATIKYAAKALKKVGAENIYVAIIARQTLD